MTKRTISYICHSVFWNLLLFLPLIFLIARFMGGGSFGTGANIEYYSNNLPVIITALRSSFVWQFFSSFFTSDFGILQSAGFLTDFFTWFTLVQLFHIFYDILIFIPKFFYKFIYKRFIKND